jgi:hypothetical protein
MSTTLRILMYLGGALALLLAAAMVVLWVALQGATFG